MSRNFCQKNGGRKMKRTFPRDRRAERRDALLTPPAKESR